MRKFILYFLLFGSILIILGGVVLGIVLAQSELEYYWQFGPLVVLVFGIKMFREVSFSIKTSKKMDKLGTLIDESTLGLNETIRKSEIDLAEMQKDFDSDLTTSMQMLLKVEDKLTANQKKMWAVIQKEVPFDNPLKIKLKKKFFTCEYEDLNQPIC